MTTDPPVPVRSARSGEAQELEQELQARIGAYQHMIDDERDVAYHEGGKQALESLQRWLTEKPSAGAARSGEIGWQTIETAPRDRKLLLYACEHHRHLFGHGYYFKGVPGDGEGWIASVFFSTPNDDTRGVFTPTHWMPLPDPPVGEIAPRAGEK